MQLKIISSTDIKASIVPRDFIKENLLKCSEFIMLEYIFFSVLFCIIGLYGAIHAELGYLTHSTRDICPLETSLHRSLTGLQGPPLNAEERKTLHTCLLE